MAHPKVSFVLPVYNAQAYIAAAVESVLGQTFGDFELLAINDGSRDGSRDVLAGFKDSRLRILDQPNSGLVKTLNRGIRESRGELVARMDSDDICMPNRLALQVDYLDKHPNVALVGGWIATIDEDGRPLSDVVPFPVRHEEIFSTIGRRPWVMCHPAVVFRRQAAIDAGLYDPAYKHAEDTEFFARFASMYRIVNLPQVVLKYRLRRDSIVSEFKDHGWANAQLVCRIRDRWKPGMVFAATPAERAETDAKIDASTRRVGKSTAKANYYNRIGRELLRGRRWGRAIKAYTTAALCKPLSLEAYKGLAAAFVHVGAAKPPPADSFADVYATSAKPAIATPVSPLMQKVSA